MSHRQTSVPHAALGCQLVLESKNNKEKSDAKTSSGRFYKFLISMFILLNNCCEPALTGFFQGCWGDGLLAKMKGLDVDTFPAGEHDCKACLSLLVLLRRAGARASGSHCTAQRSKHEVPLNKSHAVFYTHHVSSYHSRQKLSSLFRQ